MVETLIAARLAAERAPAGAARTNPSIDLRVPMGTPIPSTFSSVSGVADPNARVVIWLARGGATEYWLFRAGCLRPLPGWSVPSRWTTPMPPHGNNWPGSIARRAGRKTPAAP